MRPVLDAWVQMIEAARAMGHYARCAPGLLRPAAAAEPGIRAGVEPRHSN
jgi:hypothetical protein